MRHHNLLLAVLLFLQVNCKQKVSQQSESIVSEEKIKKIIQHSMDSMKREIHPDSFVKKNHFINVLLAGRDLWPDNLHPNIADSIFNEYIYENLNEILKNDRFMLNKSPDLFSTYKYSRSRSIIFLKSDNDKVLMYYWLNKDDGYVANVNGYILYDTLNRSMCKWYLPIGIPQKIYSIGEPYNDVYIFHTEDKTSFSTASEFIFSLKINNNGIEYYPAFASENAEEPYRLHLGETTDFIFDYDSANQKIISYTKYAGPPFKKREFVFKNGEFIKVNEKDIWELPH